jgi:outer membrane protein OmpA-like peptidoglycan-associated protein
LKSRAYNNDIENNRIFDNTGNASYSIDLPEGNAGTIRNNIIQQGPNSDNSIISYGEER